MINLNDRYYIYHIPNIKIGCSVEADIRVKTQGYDEYSILEEHSDIYKASDREIELQKQYGYQVDKIPYWQSIENFNKGRNKINYTKLGQQIQNWQKENNFLESDVFKKAIYDGGKTQGNINVLSGHMERMREKSNYNRKSISVYNRFTNELIATYNSMTDACNELGLKISKVSDTLAGNRKYHKDYTFKWN
jgi:hypothetical protein